MAQTQVEKKMSTKKSNQVLHKKNKTRPQEKSLPLPKELLRSIYSLMLKTRILEERLIKIYKAGEAFFWIGGPGEEAWGVPLGLLCHKGQGPEYDFFHLHYRATPTLVAMGMPMIDAVRLMMNRSTDPCTGGRNFSGHYCYPQWNITPITSPIGIQYSLSIGTARVQKRHNSKGITIVSGGDAGTAEGDFATCLIWASRPKQELPILITVQNNRWGISTSYSTQHGEIHIADRGKAFNIPTHVINGNDPIETYIKLKEIMTYIREKGRPVLVEAMVSRLYGHSSASGTNFIPEEDSLQLFEQKLLKQGVLKEMEITEWKEKFELEGRQAQEQVRQEPAPQESDVWNHIYANNENGDWRNF
ncbi:MAG: thiamine pyrophosphate-dependent dehydrogenase E1 component subunit alpha [Bdellovibrionales bacterium]|nr:thiamine pyrophosphate-dependent dehydrogenase E1 component subunit alpha [Bdellovibrionales bacterium]